MEIPNEPIGSIPRPLELIAALAATDCDDPSLTPLYEAAVRDTVQRFEAVGSPVVTDGEQRKYHNPLDRLGATDDCGFAPFSDDISTSRDTAFAKIRARVQGVALAAEALGAG